MEHDLDALLAEQVDYYRARAGEYDEAYSEPAMRDTLVSALPISGDVLELACGTGRWTPVLAGRARSVTAVDAAPEMIAIARTRVRGLPVEFVTADLFGWRPPRRYDTVFFGFWLSHVPPARFAGFWSTVRAALRPAGRACFIDTSDREQEIEEVLPEQVAPAARRVLRDGSEYRVVKLFWRPEELTAGLAALGWSADIRRAGGRFLTGTATPPPARLRPRSAGTERQERDGGPDASP